MQLNPKKDSLTPATNPPATPTAYQRPQKFPWFLMCRLVSYCVIGFYIFVAIIFHQGSGCKPTQAEARQNIGIINRAQKTYFLENKFFAKNLQQLKIGIQSETNNYSYSLRSIGNASYHYAIYKQGTNIPKSYASAVFSVPVNLKSFPDEIIMLEIICEAEKDGKIQPDSPTLQNNTPTCGPNTKQISPSPKK